MKNILVSISLFAAITFPLSAQPAGKGPMKNSTTEATAEPFYISESALPKGWPAPGPFNQVSQKEYPAYRAAFTQGDNPNGGFWTLFKHIQRNNIPMTSPVEMKMTNDGETGMVMEQMGFLYQSPDVGKPGADGESVTVRDVPALSVLSYTWQGPRDDAQLAKARLAIDAALAEQKLQAKDYRVLGYNGPSVPKNKQTHEMQAVLK